MVTLKEARTNAGLTLTEVAYEMRLRLGKSAPTESTISRWETNHNVGWQTNLAAVVVMASLYGVSVADLDPEMGRQVLMLRSLFAEQDRVWPAPADREATRDVWPPPVPVAALRAPRWRGGGH